MHRPASADIGSSDCGCVIVADDHCRSRAIKLDNKANYLKIELYYGIIMSHSSTNLASHTVHHSVIFHLFSTRYKFKPQLYPLALSQAFQPPCIFDYIHQKSICRKMEKKSRPHFTRTVHCYLQLSHTNSNRPPFWSSWKLASTTSCGSPRASTAYMNYQYSSEQMLYILPSKPQREQTRAK